MKESRYPEPDGYLKMRIRDFLAGGLVVLCFALAALLSHIRRNIVIKTGSLSRIKLIRLARHSKYRA